MIRILLEIAIPLLLPTMAYMAWQFMRKHKTKADGSIDVEADDVPTPWIWLAGSGVVLLLITLIATATLQGSPADSVYTAPYLKDGKVVPGQLVDPGQTK